MGVPTPAPPFPRVRTRESMRTNILLTGGAGYLGSIMTEHFLAAGHRVTALDNLMYGHQTLLHFCANPDFEFVSNQRMREAGFEATRSLDSGIQELLKGYRMFGRARGKNVSEVRSSWLIPSLPPRSGVERGRGVSEVSQV